MAEIKNTFLKGRMNQDLDSRILPEGEYREAINLLISRSEGSTVGEFENVLGNTPQQLLGLNSSANTIGHYVDETNNLVYLFLTSCKTEDRALSSDYCYILQVNLTTYNFVTLVEGFFLNLSTLYPVYGVNLVEDLLFWTDNRNQPRRINITTAQTAGSYTKESQIAVAQYYPYNSIIPLERQTVEVASTGNTATQITITASNTKIKVGDIITPNNKTVLAGSQIITNELPAVKVTRIDSPTVFIVSPAITPGALSGGDIIDFSRTTMTNRSSQYKANYSIQDVQSISTDVASGGFDIGIGEKSATGTPDIEPDFGGLPRVGDLIKNLTSPTNIPADLRVGERVNDNGDLKPGFAINLNNSVGRALWGIQCDKDPTDGGNLTGFSVGDEVSIGNNPDYDVNFKGDADFLDDKFVRFSYRYRFDNNEYSLMAPFTQVMFIPKQEGQFNLGQLELELIGPGDNPQINYYQDEIDAYSNTILQWFENDVDTIDLKIPIPSGLTELNTIYNIKKIDILYRESDALAVKVLDTLDLSNITSSQVDTISFDDDINGLSDQKFISYDYKSNKPYKTLPEAQTVRVFDKVPIKALAQELISNRVVYGNYVEKSTPPLTIPYKATFSPRDYQFSDYATQYPYSSIKQNRTYQVGFVLSDYFGRQSDVILSSYDGSESDAGSSVYVPYRNISDATDLPVLDYIGTNLSLNIEEAIGLAQNNSAGTPGIYREYGWITGLEIVTGSTNGNWELDKNYYLKVVGGNDTNLIVIRATGIVNGDELSTFVIMSAGSGFSDGDQFFPLNPSVRCTFDQTSNVGDANPLGWYSYKIVVKQQEQEYYNVYLPGFVNGLPIQNQVWDGVTFADADQNPSGVGPMRPGADPIETERGKIFFSTVLSDNINKIPRNLQEVGPTDEEYNSDEILYIRVNNPNATDTVGVRNLQYYPNQLKQDVLNLTTVRESQLAAVPFVKFKIGSSLGLPGSAIQGPGDERVYGFVHPSGFKGEYDSTVRFVRQPIITNAPSSPAEYGGNVQTVPTGCIPWGDVADAASFYAADQNPFILKAGQASNWGNPVGAIVCGQPLTGTTISVNTVYHDTNWTNGIRTMQPTLTVAETKPVYSLLDIFWESTLSGKLEDLNSAITTNYNGLVGITQSNVSFPESSIVDTDLTSGAFYFINGSGAQINAFADFTVTPYITSISTASGTVVPASEFNNYFTIEETTNPGQYQVRTKKTFWFSDNSVTPGTDIYTISIGAATNDSTNQTTGDILPDCYTLTLTNSNPIMYSDANRTVLVPDIITDPTLTPLTISVDSLATTITSLYGKNGGLDTTDSNDLKQLTWDIPVVIATQTSTATFEISSEGVITAQNLTNETVYSLTVRLSDANEGTQFLFIDRQIQVNVGTPFAPKIIMTGNIQNPEPALTGAGNRGAWYWVNQTTPSPNPSGYTIVANFQQLYRNNLGGNCQGWLFQGTIEIAITVGVQTGGSGSDAAARWQVEHRSYDGTTRGSWTRIASVVETGFFTQTATGNYEYSGLVTPGNQSVFPYKFDQLGEYRVVTNNQGLIGSAAPQAYMVVDFKDGKCRNNATGGYCTPSNGPCTPS